MFLPLCLLSMVWAATPLVLPLHEDAEAWSVAARLAGLEVGEPGEGAWVGLESGGSGWVLRVHGSGGAEKVVVVHLPDTASEREDLAWLAASLLRELDTPSPRLKVRRLPVDFTPAEVAPAEVASAEVASAEVAPAGPSPDTIPTPAPTHAAIPVAPASTTPTPAETTPPITWIITAIPPPEPLPEPQPNPTEVADIPSEGEKPAERASPPPAQARVDSALDPRSPTPMRGWVRAGSGLSWNMSTSAAAGLDAAGGLRLGEGVRLGPHVAWSAPRELLVLGNPAYLTSFELGGTAAWSPPARVAPWVAATIDASARRFLDGVETRDQHWTPVVMAELGAMIHLQPRLSVLIFARAGADLRTTTVKLGLRDPVLLSPWHAGGLLLLSLDLG